MKRLLLPSPAVIVALFVLLPAATAPIESPDLMFHLAGGRWLLEHHEFPTVDPFSPTATPTVPHEWVWGVWCELSVRALGGAGPKVLTAALIAALLIGLWRMLRVGSMSAAALFIAALFPLHFTWWQERPFHLGHLCFLGFWWALDRWRRGERHATWWLFGVTVLWANLHGSWVLSPITAGLTTLVSRRWKDGAIATVACLGAAAIHPSGLKNLIYPVVHQLLPSTRYILEWRALPLGFVFSWVLIALFVLAAWLTVKAKDRQALIPALALGIAAFIARRHAPFASLALVLAIAEQLRGESKDVWPRGGSIWAAAALTLITAASALHPRSLRDSLDGGFFPLAAIDELQKREPGRVLAQFEWGGVVSAFGGPQFQTFIDSRNDPYPIEIHRAYHAIRQQQPGWREAFTAFAPKYVLWSAEEDGAPLRNQLVAEGWTIA
ncbi:MAG: hypothetical protein ACO1OB_03900, partial [Archangium sp.]